MLPKIHRINKDLFKKVFSAGKNLHTKLIFLKISTIVEKNIRFAFAVSAKVSKKAVARNRLKRRARSITSKLLPSFKKDIAVLVFFKKGSEALDFKELEKELTFAYEKAGILV